MKTIRLYYLTEQKRKEIERELISSERLEIEFIIKDYLGKRLESAYIKAHIRGEVVEVNRFIGSRKLGESDITYYEFKERLFNTFKNFNGSILKFYKKGEI